MIPVALQTAIHEDEDFRKSLPIDYLDFMGVVHSDKASICLFFIAFSVNFAID